MINSGNKLMDLSVGLSQHQILSPQMQQGLQLLQAPMMELRHLVSAEVTANPILEEEFSLVTENQFSQEKPTIELSEEPWCDDRQQIPSLFGSQQEVEERHRYFLESRQSISTLADSILAQSATFPKKDQQLIQAIAGNLDSFGYLRASNSELAKTAGISEQHVEEVIKKIQQLDPPGVAARDLTECLLLQLERQGNGNSLASRIVRHYLPQLGQHYYDEIAAALRVNIAEVMQAHKIIARLEPHPGRPYGPIENESVVPDIIVLSEGDDFVVRLNEEGLPRVRINDHYKEILSSQAENKELRDYLRDKIRQGKQFMHSFDQRQETLLLVAREIVRRQHDFFKYGIDRMIPLTMAGVADTLDLHATTISRTVSGKYMDTPRGLFPWKYFFSSGFKKENDTAVSNEMVKETLQQLIDQENKQHPLSDQKIVELLQSRGITVARRTITNYRDQLKILPKNLRKKI